MRQTEIVPALHYDEDRPRAPPVRQTSGLAVLGAASRRTTGSKIGFVELRQHEPNTRQSARRIEQSPTHFADAGPYDCAQLVR